MNKVIYTCLVGGYDNLDEPKVIDYDWDYICFSNDVELPDNSVWKIRRIPFESDDKTTLSRYVKFHPHIVLKEYDVSVYIDANIVISGEKAYYFFDSIINNKHINIAIAKHPARDCIYQEAIACLRAGRSDFREIVSHVNFLKKQEFPEFYGLHENNIIYRLHNDESIVQVNELWWEVYLNHSKRDQLSLEYAVWKKGINIHNLFGDNFDVRQSELFKYDYHKLVLRAKIKIRYRRVINRLGLLFYRNKW